MSSANSSGSKQYHYTPLQEDRFTRPCTAPSQDAVIERLTAEVSALQDTDSKRQDECYASGYRDAEAKYTAELATAKEKLRIERDLLIRLKMVRMNGGGSLIVLNSPNDDLSRSLRQDWDLVKLAISSMSVPGESASLSGGKTDTNGGATAMPSICNTAPRTDTPLAALDAPSDPQPDREKLNPVRGDEILTRGSVVLIEDADDINVSYRCMKPDGSWSRVFLTTILAYRNWPISEVTRRGSDPQSASQEKP